MQFKQKEATDKKDMCVLCYEMRPIGVLLNKNQIDFMKSKSSDCVKVYKANSITCAKKSKANKHARLRQGIQSQRESTREGKEVNQK